MEGIVPAPEPTHAIAAAVREALACKESGEEKVILTALCGHGHLDLASYDKYLNGEMVDADLSDEVIAKAMEAVPVIVWSIRVINEIKTTPVTGILQKQLTNEERRYG